MEFLINYPDNYFYIILRQTLFPIILRNCAANYDIVPVILINSCSTIRFNNDITFRDEIQYVAFYHNLRVSSGRQ